MSHNHPAALMVRSGNVITVCPLDTKKRVPDDYMRVLDPVLSYDHRRFLYGEERLLSRSRVETEYRPLYRINAHGHLVTSLGVINRVKNALTQAGYQVLYSNQTPNTSGTRAYTVDTRLVNERFEFRPRQEECLQAILSHQMGQVIAPCGFGKMALIAMTCLAMPYAKIDVVTKSVSVVERLVDYLSDFFPVGQVGGGKNKPGPRVTIYTADSLHKSLGTADVILCDECHQLATGRFSARIFNYPTSRRFGFTASPKGRSDGADLVLTWLFGEVIFHMTYPEAVELGIVVPIEVNWLNPHSEALCFSNNDTMRFRKLVWTNQERNQAIAQAIRSHAPSQCLTLVDKVEHAIHLWREMPEAALLYGSIDDKEYKSLGLLPDDYKPLDDYRRRQMRRDFENGTIRNVIATGSWATGVSFDHLEVLCRADAGANEIYSIQGPGRVSRRSEGKAKGIVLDLRDSFDLALNRRADDRERHYRAQGWNSLDVELCHEPV